MVLYVSHDISKLLLELLEDAIAGKPLDSHEPELHKKELYLQQLPPED